MTTVSKDEYDAMVNQLQAKINAIDEAIKEVKTPSFTERFKDAAVQSNMVWLSTELQSHKLTMAARDQEFRDQLDMFFIILSKFPPSRIDSY